MAAFRKSEIYLPTTYGSEERLDYSLLKVGPVTLFHNPTMLQESIQQLREIGYVVREADCRGRTAETDVLLVILEAIGIHTSGQPNLDGFDDYLFHLEVDDDAGLVIVLHDFEQFAVSDKESAESLFDALAMASRDKLLFGK